MAQTRREQNRNQERRFSRSYSFASQPYIGGSAAPAITPKKDREKNTNLEFWVGGRKDTQAATDAVPDSAPFLFKVCAYLITVLCIVGAINVTLTGATQSSAQEATSIQTSIDKSRESGKAAEVQLGLLSNPTRIKEKAEEMGMKAATSTITINLSDDVVKLDGDGNVSLTDSLLAAAS